MKKRVAIGLILLLVIVISIFKSPVKIDEDYNGYIFSYSEDKINQKVKISLKGELTKNIFLQNKFSGEVIIGDTEMKVQTSESSGLRNIIRQFIDKIQQDPLVVQGSIINKDRYLETSGAIHLSRDFNEVWGFSKLLRDKYNNNDVLFVAPADNLNEAKNIINEKEGTLRIEYSSIKNK